MSEDPWEGLVPPKSAENVSARPVDSSIKWGFYWARGEDKRCLLLLRHEAESSPQLSLPRLRGIEVSVIDDYADGEKVLVFALEDSRQRDIFQRLARDVVASTATAVSESAAVQVALNRTWRWHYLLTGGGDGRLTAEQQKGLIGELRVLRDLLLPHLSPNQALTAWTGPLGTPKDFTVGRVSIEAKARRGSAKPSVSISSPEQLDDSGADALFLHVIELDRASPEAGDGISVTDVAAGIRDDLADSHPEDMDRYETLLAAAGFKWEDDYSDSLWLGGTSKLFSVCDEFPRLMASSIPAGVMKVGYEVSLVACAEFEVDEEALLEALRGT